MCWGYCFSRPTRKCAEPSSDFPESWTVQETQRIGWILSLLVSREHCVMKLFCSSSPKVCQAEHHNYRKNTVCIHTHRKPCNFFFMDNMASSMDHGLVCPMKNNDGDVAQHGSHTPANTKSCSLGLQHTVLILDTHIMVNWHLSKWGIHWPKWYHVTILWAQV